MRGISEKATLQHVTTTCILANVELTAVSSRLAALEMNCIRLLESGSAAASGELIDGIRREKRTWLEILDRCSKSLSEAKTKIEEIRTKKDRTLKPISRVHRKVVQHLFVVEGVRAEVERRVKNLFEICEKVQASFPKEEEEVVEGVPLQPVFEEEADVAKEASEPSANAILSRGRRFKRSCSRIVCGLGSCVAVVSVAVGALAIKVLQPNLFP